MSRTLAISAGAGMLATGLALAAPAWWIFELLTHFRVQLVAGLGMLALVFAWRRAWLWTAAVAAAAAVNAVPVAPYLITLPAAGAMSSGTLTILGVNVQASSDAYAGLRDSIDQTNPDVLVAIEFTKPWRERLAGIEDRYPFRIERPRTDPFGVAMWSRLPIDGATIELGSATAVEAVVETPGGAVRVFAVHLTPPTSADRAAERNAQLDELASRVAASPEPVVVIGDFNLTPYSPYFTSLLEHTGLKDARRGFGLDSTWPTFFPLLGIPIDHCLVSFELDVAEYRRLPAFGSDHHPVLVRLART